MRLVAWMLRLLAATWRVRVQGGQALDQALQRGPVVYAFLHGELLALTALHADKGVVGVVSRSRDGERLSSALQALGYQLVRGSSSRGAVGAARSSAQALERGDSVALAVDGPRGPRGRAKPGVAALALGAGAPVACARARVGWAVSLPTWDAFQIPLPFSTVDLSYVLLPPRGEAEALLEQVERALG
jgi:lysophospholipid acyltransferase (LPLAT)-like uncharacterized protein